MHSWSSPYQNVLGHHPCMSQNTCSISHHPYQSPHNLSTWPPCTCVVSWELVHHLLPCWSSLLSSWSSSLLSSSLSSRNHSLLSWPSLLPFSWPFLLPASLFLLPSLLFLPPSLLFLLLFAFAFVPSWLSSLLVPFSSALSVLWPAVSGVPFPEVGPNIRYWWGGVHVVEYFDQWV